MPALLCLFTVFFFCSRYIYLKWLILKQKRKRLIEVSFYGLEASQWGVKPLLEI